jgi:hypothetical protein
MNVTDPVRRVSVVSTGQVRIRRPRGAAACGRGGVLAAAVPQGGVHHDDLARRDDQLRLTGQGIHDGGRLAGCAVPGTAYSGPVRRIKSARTLPAAASARAPLTEPDAWKRQFSPVRSAGSRLRSCQ